MAVRGVRSIVRREQADGDLPHRWHADGHAKTVFGWEQLRRVRRLQPVAAAMLVLLPVIFFALEYYNHQVETIHDWARLHGGGIAEMLRDWLHPLPVPSQSLLFLCCTLLLAAGLALYSLACPARVKEFSREHWCVFGQPAHEYEADSRSRPVLRLACTLCIAVGGAGMLWVLACHLWHMAMYIASAGPFSFW